MLKLRDIFLRKLALVFLVLFLVLGASLYFWIKDIYIEEAKRDLLHNIDIFIISTKNLDEIDSTIKSIKEKTHMRVTIIDSQGRVIAESNRDKSTMDNHLFRKEIIAAKKTSYGYSIRHSTTLNKELLYIAKQTRLKNKLYFVRMARDIDEIIAAFMMVSLKTALLFGLFALFAYRMILGIGSSIEKETKKILNFLDEMGCREKKRTIYSTYSTEFAKMTKLLTETSEKLSKRRKQKNKYTARLKLANRQKDDIISAISHEFKNPITVISGYSQTLMEDTNINPSTTNTFLKKISTNAYKLSDMIDRLRLSIRLDEHKQTLQYSRCDMAQLIQHAIETLQISYPHRKIQLSISTPCTIEVDATLMEIAIVNLIENALKYSEKDPIRVILSSQSIQVIDHGIGIAPKEIEKITTKFYRVTSNSWNNSMGIGLSLVSHIVTIHGFQLSIQSQLGSGSTFEICL